MAEGNYGQQVQAYKDGPQGAARRVVQAIPKCLEGPKLLQLARDLGTDGRNLGIHLGFEPSELDSIEHDHNRDREGANHKILVRYVKDHAADGTGLIGAILEALEETGRSDLVLKLQQAAKDEGDLR